AVENIIKERTEHGQFKSFVDFCSRIDGKFVNKKTLESLIYAGAFDCLDVNRKKLFDNYEAVMHRYGIKKIVNKGQSSLFGGEKSKAELRDVVLEPLGNNYRDFSDREKLFLEKSVLGLYVSAHPLTDYEDEIAKLNPLKFGDVADIESGETDLNKLQRVRMCGIINDLKIKQSKKGNRFAVFTLEDFTGQGECVVFPKTYEQYREILRADSIVTIIGKAEENGNSIKLIVDEIKPLVKTSNTEKINKKLTISIDSGSFDPVKIYEIKSILSAKDGDTSVFIDLKNGHKESIMELENVKIHYDKYTEKVLTEIFGKDNIILQQS
ncbi:MAG: hypothetical protein IT281_05990, partial [Ignavibacteria bacterium]|nr:hypothetical protein [Ignavibacteria bacterium]